MSDVCGSVDELQEGEEGGARAASTLAQPARPGLTKLVPEVLQCIIRLLDDDTTYRILPRVCRDFKALIGSPDFVRTRLRQGHSVLLA